MHSTLLSLLALGSCIWMQCSIAEAQTKPQLPHFDLTRLFGGRSSEPLITLLDRNLPEVQQMIERTKKSCLNQLKMPAAQRSLIREPNPTEKEKCLLECVLKGIKIMDNGTNKLNLGRVEQLTSLVTEDNKVAIALSCSLAQSCNRAVTTQKPCEAAHQLNQCIGRQLERNRVKLNW
ncbi:uncharacterized protein LOC111593626 [Drosophila hydei]|uniref:Uncharacterized protein LOC111593626 n=1 Tax=Drosophila hydei TaxID=7224 RepID=A0A6J1LG46_DROHY|nr:uncharacterized protein LOC111593626 [Drosophila hydei]